MTTEKTSKRKTKKKTAWRSKTMRVRDNESKRKRRAALSAEALLELREREAQQKRIYRSNLSAEQLEDIRKRDRQRKRNERRPSSLHAVKAKKIAPRATAQAVASSKTDKTKKSKASKANQRKVQFA